MENNAYSPTDALADVDTSNDSVADRLVSPPWYHPILGLCVGALVLGTGFADDTLLLVIALAVAVAAGLLSLAYRRITGLWIGPQQAGPHSRVLWAGVMVIVFAALGVAYTARLIALPAWVVVVAAVVGTLALWVLGPRIDASLRDEIRAGSAHAQRR